jgi:hypothetical protein
MNQDSCKMAKKVLASKTHSSALNDKPCPYIARSILEEFSFDPAMPTPVSRCQSVLSLPTRSARFEAP